MMNNNTQQFVDLYSKMVDIYFGYSSQILKQNENFAHWNLLSWKTDPKFVEKVSELYAAGQISLNEYKKLSNDLVDSVQQPTASTNNFLKIQAKNQAVAYQNLQFSKQWLNDMWQLFTDKAPQASEDFKNFYQDSYNQMVSLVTPKHNKQDVAAKDKKNFDADYGTFYNTDKKS